MIFPFPHSDEKEMGNMKIFPTKINQHYSTAMIEINGEHGEIRVSNERIYRIKNGRGRFTIDKIRQEVKENDVVFVQQGSQYNFGGSMTLYITCIPSFHPEQDTRL